MRSWIFDHLIARERMSLDGRVAGVCALISALACGGASSSPATRASAVRGEIRSLVIRPLSRAACAGEPIATRYEAILQNGDRTTLGARDLALLRRSGAGVYLRDDGSWQTDVNPLISAMTGFVLHAWLESDSSVRADTIVTPTYGCARTTIDARGTASADDATYIRLGVLRSPFHDSIVVAAFESGKNTSRVMLLGPREMRNGAIRIDASGRPGSKGRAGTAGANGGPCERGAPGEQGEDGGAGGPGGRIDIIVQADAPWLANLVVISNEGGAGGAAGAGGVGGRAGTGGGGRSCPSGVQAPNGRPGRQGPAGLPGPRPTVSTIPFPLVWTGSPLWNSEETRVPLEQLIALTQR
jgi:hypothetical protein